MPFASAIAMRPTCRRLPGSCVAPVEPVPVPPTDLDAVRQQVSTFIPSTPPIAIEKQVVEGDPAREILAAAEDADLIVMGTHGRSGFERLVLGSVTETVLRKASCSLLTIPLSAAGGGSMPVVFRRIVAAVDFSDVSMAALRQAACLAAEADAHLTAMHVIEVPEHLALWIDRVDGNSHVRAWAEAAEHHLRGAVGPETREYARVDQRVETGKAYREILRVADEQQADLIVIGAHGHGVIEQMVVGSTAQHVVRSPLSWLLAASPDAACPAPRVQANGPRERGRRGRHQFNADSRIAHEEQRAGHRDPD